MTLSATDHSIRHRDGTVAMRGHRLNMQQLDQVTEILADAYSAVVVSEFLVWTDIASRMRIFVDGGWVVIGATLATAGDLGAFTAGETKNILIEITVPSGDEPGGLDGRSETLRLNISLGV